MGIVRSRLLFVLIVALVVILYVSVFGRLRLNSIDRFQRLDASRISTKIIPESAPAPALDGCGIIQDDSTVTWSNLSSNEIKFYDTVKSCALRIANGSLKNWEKTDTSKLKMLRCDRNITETVMFQSSIKEYETVWFIGDSVLCQQFFALICTVDPSVTWDQITGENEEPDTIGFEWIYNHSHGRTTKFVFSKFGILWQNLEHNLYVDAFPKAIASLNDKSAIVLDAAVHYSSVKGPLLEKALDFMSDLSSSAASSSNSTAASVFFMEPIPEEWPTSNGIYSYFFGGKTCEALTPERILGRGNISNILANPSQMRKRKRAGASTLVLLRSLSEFFGRLYPDLAFLNDTDSCIPDCLPATWRVDLVRSKLLLKSSSSNSSTTTITMTPREDIILVPVWWQLVGKKSPSGRSMPDEKGDCTHKSLEAGMMMNQQLMRSMQETNARRRRNSTT
jgi:hypothetical protein